MLINASRPTQFSCSLLVVSEKFFTIMHKMAQYVGPRVAKTADNINDQ